MNARMEVSTMGCGSEVGHLTSLRFREDILEKSRDLAFKMRDCQGGKGDRPSHIEEVGKIYDWRGGGWDVEKGSLSQLSDDTPAYHHPDKGLLKFKLMSR